MLSKIIVFTKNLKIKFKILLCMMVITTTALLFISILSFNYFSSTYEHDAKENARYTLDVASASFRNHMDIILKHTSTFVCSTPMINTLKDISLNNSDNYISNYGNIQSYLERLIESDIFIDDVMIIGKNREFFALTKYGLNYNVSNYFNWNIKNINKISLLQVRKSPLSIWKNVIPIVIPISQLNNVGDTLSPIVSGSVGNSIATVFVLLDTDYINEYFRELNKNANSTLYVADENGKPLNLLPDSDIYKIAASPDVIKHIIYPSDTSEFSKSMNNDTLLISSENVNYCGLKIVSVVSKDTLLSGIKTIKSFIVMAWILSFMLTILLSFALSQFITRPMAVLMDIVKRIKDGNYHTKRTNKYTDEIGVFIRSINSMYDTIELQMEVIKQEEQDKAKVEVKLLEDQINPHFIYNTLDCIHWEILSQNIESSAAMVESLGEFLRISLNYGRTIISIQQEITHATEYINLINHRSNHRIAFRYTLDERLANYQIVKLILQPLVENCIKHGFGNEIVNGTILSPYIEINISLQNEARVFIEVSDNGRGIDIDKATEAMYQLSVDKETVHVGLNNVYKRLRLYYSNDTNIIFNTTPYFKNTVTLDIPYSPSI